MIPNTTKNHTLRDLLIASDRRRWLDIGCGGNFEEGFRAIDCFPEVLVPEAHRERYKRIDILGITQEQRVALGRFDLIRLQHVLEHFTWEEVAHVLSNCADLLDDKGILLITVPDLRVHIDKYLGSTYRSSSFAGWAQQRIPVDAPDSCYFSVFAHSMPYEPHKWCYDQTEFEYSSQSMGKFTHVEFLPRSSPLARVPFTHNRPDEDVCVIAGLAE